MSMEINTKICSRCGKQKHVSEFQVETNRHIKAHGGINRRVVGQCIRCREFTYRVMWEKENPEKMAKYAETRKARDESRLCCRCNRLLAVSEFGRRVLEPGECMDCVSVRIEKLKVFYGTKTLPVV